MIIRILPPAQVLLAILLISSNAVRPDTIERPAYTRADIQFCHALNAPVSMPIGFLVLATGAWAPYHAVVEFVITRYLYLAFIWLLWYGVGIELSGHGQSVLMPKTGRRAAGDIVAMAVGAVLLSFSWGLIEFGRGAHAQSVRVVAYFIWGVAILGFYGHDLWISRIQSNGREIT